LTVFWGYRAALSGLFLRRIALSENIDLANYVPSENEEFMNSRQRSYFRTKLVAWKTDILREAPITPIWPTGPLPKPTVPSNFAPATGSAS